MAPRKSTESDKEKNNDEYSSENEGDVSNSNDDCGGSENEPIKKSNKANGKEASVDKNGEGDEDDNDETGDQDADEDENANGKNDDDEDEQDDDDAEDDDDDAPIKKRKTARKAAKPSKKKAAKASPKKKKVAGKKAVVEEENGEEEYEVKEVIDSKKEKNVLYYLIRWKGFTAADDTWEKAVNLTCDDLIAAFNKKNQNKKSAPATTTAAAAKQPPKKRKKVEENVDPEKEYEVDKVVDMEENKKGRVFRIRWKGYRPHQDTWEPEDNLNCKDLIEKFLIKHKADSEIPQKELREEPKRTKRLVNETRYTPGARTSRRTSAKVRKTYYSEDENSD